MSSVTQIEDLIRKINRHPCKPEDLSRALTIITNTLTEIHNVSRKGTYMGKVRAVIDSIGCDGTQDSATSDGATITVDPATFELWGIDDPDDPVTVPSEVINDFEFLIKHDDFLAIAYEPSEDSGGGGDWHLVVPTHKTRTVLLDVTKDDDEFRKTIETKFSVAGGYCPTSEVVFQTTLATVMREIRLDSSGQCVVKSMPTEMEVFSKDESVVETEEWSYSGVSVLNDIYTYSPAPCTIRAFRYLIYTPCMTPTGESTAANIGCCCDDDDSGGDTCDCALCVVVEYNITASASDVGGLFFDSGTARINLDGSTPNCDYLLYDTENLPEDIAIRFQYNCDTGTVSISITRTAGGWSYVNDQDLTMPLVEEVPYDSGEVVLYSGHDITKIVGSVRVYTETEACEEGLDDNEDT